MVGSLGIKPGSNPRRMPSKKTVKLLPSGSKWFSNKFSKTGRTGVAALEYRGNKPVLKNKTKFIENSLEH